MNRIFAAKALSRAGEIPWELLPVTDFLYILIDKGKF